MQFAKRRFTKIINPNTSALELWRQIVLPTLYDPVPVPPGMRDQGPSGASGAPLVRKPSPADNIDEQHHPPKEACHD